MICIATCSPLCICHFPFFSCLILILPQSPDQQLNWAFVFDWPHLLCQSFIVYFIIYPISFIRLCLIPLPFIFLWCYMALSSKDFTNASSSKAGGCRMSGVLQISRTSLGFMENQSWPDIISTFFPLH